MLREYAASKTRLEGLPEPACNRTCISLSFSRESRYIEITGFTMTLHERDTSLSEGRGTVMTYTRLFESGRVGGLELKNRTVMPAMSCSPAEASGEAGQRIIQYCAARPGLIFDVLHSAYDRALSAIDKRQPLSSCVRFR